MEILITVIVMFFFLGRNNNKENEELKASNNDFSREVERLYDEINEAQHLIDDITDCHVESNELHQKESEDHLKVEKELTEQIIRLQTYINTSLQYNETGFAITPIESDVDKIKKMTYDQFIDYLEGLNIHELTSVRDLLEHNKLESQLAAMNGYMKNRTRSK
jgi:seryl-tRNA synthetase